MGKTINLFTIGFTKKSAEQFFTSLQQVGVQRIIRPDATRSGRG